MVARRRFVTRGHTAGGSLDVSPVSPFIRIYAVQIFTAPLLFTGVRF